MPSNMSWQIGKKINDSNSTPKAISACVFNNKLHLFYPGNGSPYNIWTCASGDGVNWPGDNTINRTDTTPEAVSSCVFQNKLYLFWRANSSGGSICYSASGDGANWPVGRGINSIDSTPKAISACVFNGKLYLFWKANDPGNRIYFSASSDGVNWPTGRMINNSDSTPEAVSACVFNGKLYLFWKANDASNCIWYCASGDGESWHNSKLINDTDSTPKAIGCCVFQNNLLLLWKANDASNTIYWSISADGASWPGGRSLFSESTPEPPSACVFNNTLFTFWKANESNNKIWTSLSHGEPAIGCIDTPTVNQGVNGTITVAGWYLDNKGVSNIDVYVDQAQGATPATYGDSRPDVEAVYPLYHNGNSGYHCSLNTDHWSGGLHTITVQEINNLDERNSVSVQVAHELLVIQATGLKSSYVVNEESSITYTASGGVAPYAFSYSASGPITFMLIPAADKCSASTAGPFEVAGTIVLTVVVTDALGAKATRSDTLLVNPWINISPTILPAGVANSPYSVTFTSSNGTGPYTYSLVSGSLPAGLTLSGSGTLSGTPTASGSSSFLIKSTDAHNYYGERQYNLSVSQSTSSKLTGSLAVNMQEIINPQGGDSGSYAGDAGAPPNCKNAVVVSLGYPGPWAEGSVSCNNVAYKPGCSVAGHWEDEVSFSSSNPLPTQFTLIINWKQP